MCYPKVHAVIEYIKRQNDFCFDVVDVLESPQNILNYYNVFFSFSPGEMQNLQAELMKLAEAFQTSEMVLQYAQESDQTIMRWLK